MKGEVVPAAQELLERDKLVRPIRDEDPHTGDHGQIEVVRVGGALRMRGFDRDTGEWVDVGGGGSVAVTRYRTLSVAANTNTLDWRELSAALPNDIYITAVVFHTDKVGIASTLNSPSFVEVASGPVGSEAVLLGGLPAILTSLTVAFGIAAVFPLSTPVMVAAGTRLVSRSLGNTGAAPGWFTTDNAQINVYYYEDADLA